MTVQVTNGAFFLGKDLASPSKAASLFPTSAASGVQNEGLALQCSRTHLAIDDGESKGT